MTIPTEPIGSMPRPMELLQAIERIDGDSDPHTSTTRDTAFAKIKSRVEATRVASDILLRK